MPSANTAPSISTKIPPFIAASYRRLSNKLEELIQTHRENWTVLAEEYELLRREVEAGRTETIDGLTKEATTFYDHVQQLAFNGSGVPVEHRKALQNLMTRIVDMLGDTIGILDFWKKPVEVKRLRGRIDTELLAVSIPELNLSHERIAVEIVKLAEKRHQDLLR
jgi:type I restriction enzyme, R subunit